MSCSPAIFTPQPILSRPTFTPSYNPQPQPPLPQLPRAIFYPSFPSSSSYNHPHRAQPQPHPQPHSCSKYALSRPKLVPKSKPCPSTPLKQKSVQLSLELKVERAKGFHAFFVPLARSMPPAPPSSPVLRPSQGPPGGHGDKQLDLDFFGRWQEGIRPRDEWVEDVEGEGMEVDSE